jgi:ketosteroid isomerase-like protein
MKIILPLSIAAVLVTATAHAQMKLPELKKQPTPQAVLDEHFAALNACDWDRLLAQYPEDAQIHLANGMIIKGAPRSAICSWDFARIQRTAD